MKYVLLGIGILMLSVLALGAKSCVNAFNNPYNHGSGASGW